jgi:hypothetical protein
MSFEIHNQLPRAETFVTRYKRGIEGFIRGLNLLQPRDIPFLEETMSPSCHDGKNQNLQTYDMAMTTG